MSEFDKKFPKPEKIECLSDAMNTLVNDRNLVIWNNERNGWIAAIKYIKSQGCAPASIIEKEIEELKRKINNEISQTKENS